MYISPLITRKIHIFNFFLLVLALFKLKVCYNTSKLNHIVRKVVLSCVTSRIHLRYLNLPKKRRSHGSHA